MERARDWKTETMPVPADLLVYTAGEWEALRNGDSRFAKVLAAETVWLVRGRGKRTRMSPSTVADTMER